MEIFSSDICHEKLLRKRKPLLAYDENKNFKVWREQIREKVTELLGDMPEKRVPLNVRIEWEKEHDTFIEKRFVFDSEEFASVPCHLLIPKGATKPLPAVICLQGHSTGMHISLGRKKHFPRDNDEVGFLDRDYGIQAVKEGYVALIMEQRGFGERISMKSFGDEEPDYYRTGCYHPAMVALLLGRTLLGERVWDISRAIDALGEAFSDIVDMDKIACIGNSGGGTATYYAACMDERIKIAMPCCCVCTFEESIGIMYHCSCNYLPGIAKYMSMGELASLIAPRKLIVVAGEKDNGFYIKGSLDAYSVIEKIYKKVGCEENCRLIVGKEGHRFYADPSWKVFREMSGWE